MEPFLKGKATAKDARQAPAKVIYETATVKEEVTGDLPEKPGRILFYMPMTTKSVKITFTPLAEALAERGHEIVVIMPHQQKAKSSNLKIFTIESEFEGGLG